MATFILVLAVICALLLCYENEFINIININKMRFGKALIFGIILAYTLWGVYAGWVCINIYKNIIAFTSPEAALTAPKNILDTLLAQGDLHAGRNAEILSLLFNLWALAGTLGLLKIRLSKRWKRLTRVSIGTFFAGLMFGRPFVGWISWVGIILPQKGWLIFITYTIGPPMAMLFAGMLAIYGALRVVGWPVGLIFTYLVLVPVIVFNQVLAFDRGLQVYQHQKRGLLGYIIRFGYWLKRESLPPAPPDDTKGARFATEEEIFQLIRKDGTNFGKILHEIEIKHERFKTKKVLKSLKLRNKKHVLIMASTRSGKGVTLIIPHLFRYHGSCFVLDPKGENAFYTYKQRLKLNKHVRVLDPFGVSGQPQARFNPLSRFTPENMEAESKALAAALIMGEQGKRDHWTTSAEQLLAALILYMVASPDFPESETDLGTVRRLLLGAWDHTLKEMAQSDLLDGLISDLATSFLKTPEKELGSIVSTAQRETEILDNPYILKCLAASGEGEAVDFKEWHKSSLSVFLCLPAPKFPLFSRWLRLVLTSALNDMTETLDPPKLPVCFMLDELATLGHLQVVENAVGLAAGYGVQIWAVFQDLAQMKDLYKSRWASFIGNAGVRVVFSLEDYDTALYWSKFTGNHLAQTASEAQNIYGFAQGQTVSETMRPLLSPEEIMLRFANIDNEMKILEYIENMLVFVQGSRPIIAKRVAFFDDQEFFKLLVELGHA